MDCFEVVVKEAVVTEFVPNGKAALIHDLLPVEFLTYAYWDI